MSTVAKQTIAATGAGTEVSLKEYGKAAVACYCGAGDGVWKVEHTFDDVNVVGASAAKWFNHDTLVSKTGSAQGHYTFAPLFCRINVTTVDASSMIFYVITHDED